MTSVAIPSASICRISRWRADQVGGWGVFSHVALDAGLERLAQQAGTPVGGEDDDRRAQTLVQPLDELADVGPRSPGIHYHDVGPPTVGRFERRLQVLGAVHVGFRPRGGEQSHHPLPHDRVLVDDEAVRHLLLRGSHV